MKKQIKKEKKLSLKKLQLMKISNMRTINGGNAANLDGDGDVVTKPKTYGGGL